MEVETRKRGATDDNLASAAVKRLRSCEEVGVLDDDIVDWLSLDCETMEVESRKRGGAGDAVDSAAVKRSRSCEEVGDLDDDIVDWLSLDGETMDELMKFLDSDGDGGGEGSSSSSCSASQVKFIENPYSSLLVFQSSSSYITINGNEESCGSSFSDWECSVMASVDTGGGAMRSGESCEAREWFGGGAWGNESEVAVFYHFGEKRG